MQGICCRLFFSQSDRRAVCVRNLLRCKNGGGTRHGISDGTGSKRSLPGHRSQQHLSGQRSLWDLCFLMSRRVHNMSMLVVSGVMIGYICSAITELVVTFASDAEIVNLHNWSREVFRE